MHRRKAPTSVVSSILSSSSSSSSTSSAHTQNLASTASITSSGFAFPNLYKLFKKFRRDPWIRNTENSKRPYAAKSTFFPHLHILLSLWTLLLLLSYFILLFQQSSDSLLSDPSFSSLSSFSSSSSSSSSSNSLVHTYTRNTSIADLSYRSDSLTFELFTAPKPFRGIDKRLNERAIKSWLSIPQLSRITLLGDEYGYARAARRFKLAHIRQIDTTFLNVPLFHSLINVAMARSNSTISIFVNGDILLYDDIIVTLRKLAVNFKHFVAVAARFDVNTPPPRQRRRARARRRFIRTHGVLHSYGGIDLWAWTNNGPSLIQSGKMIPPFIFGRGRYDNWLTHEMISASSSSFNSQQQTQQRREVIDISESAMLVHVRHDYGLVEKSVGRKLNRDVKDDFWAEGKHAKFELFINVYLSLHSGSYSYQKGSPLFTPWKAVRCIENGGVCLVRRKRPGICPCEAAPFVIESMTDPVITRGENVIRCGRVIREYVENYTIPVTINDGKAEVQMLRSRGLMLAQRNDDDDDDDDDNDGKPATAGDGNQNNVDENDIPFGMPFTLKSLASRVTINGTVVLTAVTHAYRVMLMNWVCNLRMLGMKNFMIAALDKDLYRYAFLHSLPVFYDDMLHNHNNNNEEDMHVQAEYGTDAFRAVTKLKTRVVRHVLRAGYDVVWCDVDVILFRNPIPYMHSLPGDIVMQSNAPDTVALNRRRRLNSGFYLVRSSPKTIRALLEIIVYAAQSPHLSEQPCVYDVLCGTHAEHSVGENRCVYNDVTTYILERDLFPNGITRRMWNITDGLIHATWPDLYIIHNNWIVGQRAKWERFKRHGFIFFDRQSNLCTYPTKW